MAAAAPSSDMFDEIVMAEERWGWWRSIGWGTGTAVRRAGLERGSSLAAGNGRPRGRGPGLGLGVHSRR